MRRFNVTTKLKLNAVKNLTQSQKDAIHATAEQMLTEIIRDQVIPFDEGTLQNVQTYVDTKNKNKGEVSIVHDTPYAQRLYFHPEYNFDRTINANAKGEWWEDWLRGNKKKRPRELYKQFYRKYSRRYVK